MSDYGELHQSSSRGIKKLLPYLGPAFIAAVAYIDPGNYATNITAGSKYGYTLLWVIFASNLMAVLIQSLSAKLGIATGKIFLSYAGRDFQKRHLSYYGCRLKRLSWQPIWLNL